ncbi:integrase core domain-containing protein [Acetivibrio clariflavus]|uniref:integrase core domain-containing protein n=1 Tax=Acetivibrio clariflavus TaxID=288965 RepID=UPI003B84996B
MKIVKRVSNFGKKRGKYIEYYNNKRPHQSLGYKTPSEYYFGINKEIKAVV